MTDARHLLGLSQVAQMVSGEVTYSTHIIAALSDSERAGGSGSMIENLTCPSGAAAQASTLWHLL